MKKIIPFFVVVLLIISSFFRCTPTVQNAPEDDDLLTSLSGVYQDTLIVEVVGYSGRYIDTFVNMPNHNLDRYKYYDFKIGLEKIDSLNLLRMFAQQNISMRGALVDLQNIKPMFNVFDDANAFKLMPVALSDSITKFSSFVRNDSLNINFVSKSLIGQIDLIDSLTVDTLFYIYKVKFKGRKIN